MKRVTTRVIRPRGPEVVNDVELMGPSLRQTAGRYEAAPAERLDGTAEK